ncbi:hypothetical protein D3C74_161240 [compost metagenome]
MTTVPGQGRGGDAGPALSRLKNKGRLSKAASRGVVSSMSTAPDEEQPVVRPATQSRAPRVEPIEIPQAAEPYQQLAPVQQPEPVQEPAAQQPVTETAQPSAKPKSRRKMSLAPSEDEHDQIRQTYMATRHIHRFSSLNDFLRACVLQEVSRLEDEYNDGRPFEWEEAEIPKGRPLRF